MPTTRSATTSTGDELIAEFKADAQAAYDRREETLTAEVMRELERRVLLTVLDRKWREHLYEMDYLREGIGLRAMAQRDPLVEYQREGSDMFNAMMEAFMEEVVGFVFHLEVQVEPAPAAAVGVAAGPGGAPLTVGNRANGSRGSHGNDRSNGRHLIESGPDPDGPGVELHASARTSTTRTSTHEDRSEPDELAEPEPVAARPFVKAKGLEGRAPRAVSYSAPARTARRQRTGSTGADQADPYEGVGRNAPCPCGSGKKFKMCHGPRPALGEVVPELHAAVRLEARSHRGRDRRRCRHRGRRHGCSPRPERRRAGTSPTVSTSSPAPAPSSAAARPAPTPTRDQGARRFPHRWRVSKNEVIAVKVENIAAARPQVGLRFADIVFVEEVEGAQTRLIAVYHTTLPGPARSGPQRPEHRRPAAAAVRQARPGLQRRELRRPGARSSKSSIVPIERSTRDHRRVAPHNVFVDLD